MANRANRPGRNKPTGAAKGNAALGSQQAPGATEPGRLSVGRRPVPAVQPAPAVSPAGQPVPPAAELLDLCPESPFGPPDRRWQLGRRLAACEWVPDEWVDRWVLLAEEVLTTPEAPAPGAPDLRAVAGARDLSERGPYWLRVEVEARLLAGERTPTVAAKSGLPAPVVGAYEALFFAVTDRLRHPSYVTHVAVRLYAPGGETDPGRHVRMLGYQGGPHVLDAVLAAVVAPRPGASDRSELWEPKDLLLARLAVELRATPASAANATRWLQLLALMREAAHSRRRGRTDAPPAR